MENERMFIIVKFLDGSIRYRKRISPFNHGVIKEQEGVSDDLQKILRLMRPYNEALGGIPFVAEIDSIDNSWAITPHYIIKNMPSATITGKDINDIEDAVIEQLLKDLKINKQRCRKYLTTSCFLYFRLETVLYDPDDETHIGIDI